MSIKHQQHENGLAYALVALPGIVALLIGLCLSGVAILIVGGIGATVSLLAFFAFAVGAEVVDPKTLIAAPTDAGGTCAIPQDPGVLTEPIIAYRCWDICSWPQAIRLQSTATAYEWEPLQAPPAASIHGFRKDDIATTGAQFILHASEQTQYGYHAYKNVEVGRTFSPGRICGRVALWGTIMQHEEGYRSQFAYPQVLYLNPGVPTYPSDDIVRALARTYGVDVAPMPPEMKELANGFDPRFADEVIANLELHRRNITSAAAAPREHGVVGPSPQTIISTVHQALAAQQQNMTQMQQNAMLMQQTAQMVQQMQQQTNVFLGQLGGGLNINSTPPPTTPPAP